jgi:hypothetical protein
VLNLRAVSGREPVVSICSVSEHIRPCLEGRDFCPAWRVVNLALHSNLLTMFADTTPCKNIHFLGAQMNADKHDSIEDFDMREKNIG